LDAGRFKLPTKDIANLAKGAYDVKYDFSNSTGTIVDRLSTRFSLQPFLGIWGKRIDRFFTAVAGPGSAIRLDLASKKNHKVVNLQALLERYRSSKAYLMISPADFFRRFHVSNR
jgi:hypothetical protein